MTQIVATACLLGIIVLASESVLGSNDQNTLLRDVYRYDHRHPLHGGPGVRGTYFFGYPYGNYHSASGTVAYLPNTKMNYYQGSYKPRPENRRYVPLHIQEKGYPQPYIQPQAYSQSEMYPNQEGYPRYQYYQPYHHPLVSERYPLPIYNPFTRNQAGHGNEVPEEEASSVIKAADKEVHLYRPVDKVLYVRSSNEVEEPTEEGSEQEVDPQSKESVETYSSEETSEPEPAAESLYTEPKAEPTVAVATEGRNVLTEVPDEMDHEDKFTGYIHGYSTIAPIALDSPFCVGLSDGNFANPGLTPDADPRCTYIVCAGQRPILFNCAPGTFNGRTILYQAGTYDRSSPNYKAPPHYRFSSYGADFCGHLDLGSLTKGPICTRSRRRVRDTSAPGVEEPSSKQSSAKEEEREPATQKLQEAVEFPDSEPSIPVLPASNEVEAVEYSIPEPKMSSDEKIPPNEFGVRPPPIFTLPFPSEGAIEVPVVPVEPTTDNVEGAQSEVPEGPKAAGKTVDPVPQVPQVVSRPEGKSFYLARKRSQDYSRYRSGYGSGAKALNNDFCVNMENGNYANPGISIDADPRCTYIVCSAEQAYLFNCPPGTFNGAKYPHHFPHFGVISYAHAYHYRHPGSGFCGTPDGQRVCSR